MNPSACLIVANAGIGPVLSLGAANILALIPIVLVEALFLRAFVVPRMPQALRLSLVANLLSTIPGLLLGPILVSRDTKDLGSFVVTMVICFAVTLAVEGAYLRRAVPEVRGPTVLATTVGMNVVSYMLLLGLMIAVAPSTGGREMARRINCAGNLKQIGLAARMYTDDNASQFPQELHQLVLTGNLTTPKCFTCPSTTTEAPETIKTKAGFVTDYVYESPGKLADPRQAASIPIAWDKPENHTSFGNVLFADGHVKGFAGKDWLAKARPAK